MSDVADIKGMMDGLNELARDALSVGPSEAECLGAAAIDRINELEAVERSAREWANSDNHMDAVAAAAKLIDALGECATDNNAGKDGTR